MTEKKIKILTLSDHPLSPSGVGTQTKYIIEGMLATGRYEFLSFAGAMKHEDYTPQKTEQWGDDWIIAPVDGYGSQDQIRSAIRQQRPDILWFMTDPRFYGWLWEIENEIRSLIPMIYYHVWDNYPYPNFNKKFYDSNDFVACISKVTHDIVKTVSPTVDSQYVPHAVNPEFFKKLDADAVQQFRNSHLNDPNKMVFFWNNRNARRKQSGTLIYWFKEFLDKVGHDKACLIMHTEPKDVHGQDLEHIMFELGLKSGEVMLSREKIPPQDMAMMYNMADCTINISDAEGFGLATLESLACETPIIVNMTGGLQEQVTDGDNWFGFGIEPCSKAVIGSQEVPYIYEDRINKDDFVNALTNFYNLTTEERAELGRLGAEYVSKNYNFDDFINQWDRILTEAHEKWGSWSTRTGYKPYTFLEIT
jgi:glycosyltransferase involved in cell wall biosynthesis